MIRLHPVPDAEHTCPYCQASLEVKGWYIPGMRNLADLKCPQCGLEFYGDLPAGHGRYYPMLLERATGIVHDEYHIDWFAGWLGDSYANRLSSPIGFSVETFRPLKKMLLLNCLDVLYGHCLLKLLNAQYYLDHCPDFDLVVLIPRFLRWMVPDGAAAIWTVDLPLRRGTEWNDWLAAEIKRQIEPLEKCWLSVAISDLHPDDFDIERFTRVCPFPLDEWRSDERPTMTFIWRDDRVWQDLSLFGRLQRWAQKLEQRLGLVERLPHEQKYLVTLAKDLRGAYPQLDFAVVGMGRPGGLPNWIRDLRRLKIDAHVEKTWCERYAQSHIVIGVHGSNMLLPSAHAGAVMELVPSDRWRNLIQDILLTGQDPRETMFRYKFLPLDTSAVVVVEVIKSLLHYPNVMLNFDPRLSAHSMPSDPWQIVRRRREIIKGMAD